MGIQNCKRCGKVFVSTGSPICQDCVKKEDEQFGVVKKYLTEKPGSSVERISRDTGIQADLVARFVRQGRIVGTGQENTDSSVCSICKRPISKGKICARCYSALSGLPSKELAGIGQAERPDSGFDKESPKAKSGEQMYTMELIRRRRK